MDGWSKDGMRKVSMNNSPESKTTTDLGQVASPLFSMHSSSTNIQR